MSTAGSGPRQKVRLSGRESIWSGRCCPWNASLDERRGQVIYRYGKTAREGERMDDLEFIAPMTSYIPDKGQVTVRYYSLYANAQRGKVKKASVSSFVLRMAEEEAKPVPSKGWAALIRKPHEGRRSAEMIRKIYEVDPMLCPQCGGKTRVISFLTDFAVVDKIIDHLKLIFVVDKPPPPHIAFQELLTAAETPAEYFS